MIVVDTSAVVDLLLESPANAMLIERLGSVSEMHAPHLIDVEFLSVLRRLVGRDMVTGTQADVARRKFKQLPLHRYPHHPLGDRAWALRATVTAYDAQYIALAELLGLPLVTSDARLARSSGHGAVVEAFVR